MYLKLFLLQRMKLTSAGANKMIKAWNEDLEGLLKKEEAESRTTYGINEEPLPANYDFARMQQQMDALNQKIAVLRHAVNVFNTTTVLEGFGFTIDEALVRMAMLTKKKQRLAQMKQVPSLVRTSPGYGSNTPRCMRDCIAAFYQSLNLIHNLDQITKQPKFVTLYQNLMALPDSNKNAFTPEYHGHPSSSTSNSKSRLARSSVSCKAVS